MTAPQAAASAGAGSTCQCAQARVLAAARLAKSPPRRSSSYHSARRWLQEGWRPLVGCLPVLVLAALPTRALLAVTAAVFDAAALVRVELSLFGSIRFSRTIIPRGECRYSFEHRSQASSGSLSTSGREKLGIGCAVRLFFAARGRHGTNTTSPAATHRRRRHAARARSQRRYAARSAATLPAARARRQRGVGKLDVETQSRWRCGTSRPGGERRRDSRAARPA